MAKFAALFNQTTSAISSFEGIFFSPKVIKILVQNLKLIFENLQTELYFLFLRIMQLFQKIFGRYIKPSCLKETKELSKVDFLNPEN